MNHVLQMDISINNFYTCTSDGHIHKSCTSDGHFHKSCTTDGHISILCTSDGHFHKPFP